MFGINAASEIFQNTVAELLNRCRNISDDIIVYGKTVVEYDANLRAVLNRLRENNARLNKEKSQTTVTFYGRVFDADEIREDRVDQERTSTNQCFRSSITSWHGSVCIQVHS